MKVKQFLELSEILIAANLMRFDYISLGNLAFFVEDYVNYPKWELIKKEIKNYIVAGKGQNAILIIMNGVYNIAERQKCSSLIAEQFEIKRQKYLIRKLDSFNLIENPMFFPDWYHDLMEFRHLETKQEAYDYYMNKLVLNPGMKDLLDKEKHRWSLAYLVTNSFCDKKWNEISYGLSAAVEPGYVNEISWRIYKWNHFQYLEDLTALKKSGLIREIDGQYSYRERALILYQISEKLYIKKQLNYFDVVPEELRKGMIIDLSI